MVGGGVSFFPKVTLKQVMQLNPENRVHMPSSSFPTLSHIGWISFTFQNITCIPHMAYRMYTNQNGMVHFFSEHTEVAFFEFTSLNTFLSIMWLHKCNFHSIYSTGGLQLLLYHYLATVYCINSLLCMMRQF
jgi:hypothetical protein